MLYELHRRRYRKPKELPASVGPVSNRTCPIKNRTYVAPGTQRYHAAGQRTCPIRNRTYVVPGTQRYHAAGQRTCPIRNRTYVVPGTQRYHAAGQRTCPIRNRTYVAPALKARPFFSRIRALAHYSTPRPVRGSWPCLSSFQLE